jgi:hypothetical protein
MGRPNQRQKAEQRCASSFIVQLYLKNHPSKTPEKKAALPSPRVSRGAQPLGLHFFVYSTFLGVIHFLPSFVATTPVTVPGKRSPPQMAS